MTGSADSVVSSGGRRYLVRAFIILWLTVQTVGPFVQKFEIPSFRYRYARFSWAMFTRALPVYDAALFRINETGEREPIPDIDRYIPGYQSPNPMRLKVHYLTVEEVQDRFARLITQIARDRSDGYVYVASIHWIKSVNPAVPDRWEFRTYGTARPDRRQAG
jgi:hypothetical protein